MAILRYGFSKSYTAIVRCNFSMIMKINYTLISCFFRKQSKLLPRGGVEELMNYFTRAIVRGLPNQDCFLEIQEMTVTLSKVKAGFSSNTFTYGPKAGNVCELKFNSENFCICK